MDSIAPPGQAGGRLTFDLSRRIRAFPSGVKNVTGGETRSSKPRTIRSGISSIAPELFLRFPFLTDGANRVIRRALESDNESYRVSPWIEPLLESWLSSQRPSRPVFCFINLTDAHDPYMTDPLIDGFQAVVAGIQGFATTRRLPTRPKPA